MPERRKQVAHKSVLTQRSHTNKQTAQQQLTVQKRHCNRRHQPWIDCIRLFRMPFVANGHACVPRSRTTHVARRRTVAAPRGDVQWRAVKQCQNEQSKWHTNAMTQRSHTNKQTTKQQLTLQKRCCKRHRQPMIDCICSFRRYFVAIVAWHACVPCSRTTHIARRRTVAVARCDVPRRAVKQYQNERRK